MDDGRADRVICRGYLAPVIEAIRCYNEKHFNLKPYWSEANIEFTCLFIVCRSMLACLVLCGIKIELQYSLPP